MKIVLDRNDLIAGKEKYHGKFLTIKDFRWFSFQVVYQASEIVFIDDGKEYVFKDRYK